MHQRIPRDLKKNLIYRRRIWALKGGDRRAFLEACKRDCLFWINSCVWQYNPNAIGSSSLEIGPFITWDFQDRAVEAIESAIEDRKDLLFEKSREMGASWLCLLKLLHRSLFRPWQKFLVISRNEHAVDRPGEPDALFWKLDFVLDRLPTWMVAGVERRKMGFVFPTGSTITGQASTGKAGVGGRATAMFIDEFSMIAEDFEVLHRTSDTTGCRIFNGTHRGTNTAFHELSQRVDMRKLVMHWTQHPDKRKGAYRYDGKIEVLDKKFEYPREFQFQHTEAPAGGPYPGIRSPWYDEQCQRKGNPRAVAMDLDIDPSGSASQFFNPVTIRQLRNVFCISPLWEGDINYDPDTGKPRGLVELPGGPLKLWINPKADESFPKSKYGAGADISTGQGATPSCLSIGDSQTGEKVASYSTSTMDPKQFAPIVTALCWLFKDDKGEPAKLAWEHVGPGQIFGKKLLELGYSNIHTRQMGLQRTGIFQDSESPGWYPTPEKKLELLTEYRGALDSRKFVNRDDEAMRECLSYRYRKDGFVEHALEDNNDPTGARVNHGDHVIADALSNKMMQTLGVQRAKEKETVPIGSLAWRRTLRDNRRRA